LCLSHDAHTVEITPHIRPLESVRLLDTASTESNLRGPLAAACGEPHNGEGHDPRVTEYSV